MFEPRDDAHSIDFDKRRVRAFESPIPKSDEPEARVIKENDLDSEEMQEIHKQLLGYYRRELDRQYENRAEQGLDEDFYDGMQWSEEDASALRERGQVPLVYNVIATTLNWIIGAQKRQRVDYKVLPRRKYDAKPAERKTALLKYLSDVNKTVFARSRAFEDAIKVGVGWLECGVEDSGTSDPVYSRYESWRNMLWDSAAVEDDLSDARYISRSKWADTDILREIFPDRAQLIQESIDDLAVYASGVEADGDEQMDAQEYESQQSGLFRGELVTSTRPRVRVIEMWFRKPVEAYRMAGGNFEGDLYDYSESHNDELRSGRATLEKKRVMRIYVALFTARGLLWFGPSPYRHNRYPFTPVWGYKRGRDAMPYGMIRGIRDIQQDINKRASKALYILSSNKVVMDDDALPDDVSLKEFADEVSRPDAIIRKKKNSQITLNADRELAPAHIELMSKSISLIQQSSGITDELLGNATNAVSGVAITRRQTQGTVATAGLFDHLRYAMQTHGEKELSLIEQFYTKEKELRITDMRGRPEYVSINSGLPDDDITRTKADFIISEADWHSSLRHAAAEQLLQLAQSAPQTILFILDLLVENLDLPNREEIVRRIRLSTGLPDPDAEEPTPEQLTMMKLRQTMMQLNLESAFADLDTKKANAAWTFAQAKQADARAAQSVAQAKKLLADAVNGNVTSQENAIKAALMLLTAAPAQPVADHILDEAGFVGAPEQRAAALARMQAQQRMMQAMPHPQAQQGLGIAPPPRQAAPTPAQAPQQHQQPAAPPQGAIQ